MNLRTIASGLLGGALSLFATPNDNIVTNVEPPYWWTGMANDTLQVMLTGPGIAGANASVKYKGIRLAEQVSLDSPDYKFLYFVISPEAKPGIMNIELVLDGHSHRIPY